ncbi:MAG: hypothetical protein KDK37_17440 [Leptospiraceae bacterium]|nr:hypothetical protein [Leptospiraceae bacterium]
MKELIWKILLVLAGIGNLLNALWMLIDPEGWFFELPAAVPDFGPLNVHMVRDLGALFLTWAGLHFWAAFAPRLRATLLAIMAIWYLQHALVHVFDTARGLVGPEHWIIDLPMVYVPALIYAFFSLYFARQTELPA